MYVKVKNSSYFLTLMNEDIFAKVAFYKKDDFEITNDKLLVLKRNIKKAKSKYDVLVVLLSIVLKSNNEELIKNVSLKLEKANNNLNTCTRDLEIFESKLAYLLLKGILKIDKVKYFGFGEEYIKNLLTRYSNQLEDQYNEYYYNEKTGLTSQLNKGKPSMVLPYTPFSVKKELEKREVKQNSKRI